ncbi:MAG: hypothetical protein OXI96_00780 [Acidimicrobiaceae bacterium]|nr:hypothetical protein [Acidimicrobiaceae bacterium]
MTGYLPRIVHTELGDPTAAPAVSIEDPRAIGKTETFLQRVGTVHSLDDPEQPAVLAAIPKRVTTGDPASAHRRVTMPTQFMGTASRATPRLRWWAL